MKAGRIVEQSDADDLFVAPQHAYTKAPLDAVPRIEFAKQPARVSDYDPEWPN